MRIYKVNIEHATYGQNWSRTKVAARSFDEAVKFAKRKLERRERIESVELLASSD